MISYIDGPDGSTVFLLSRCDYIWRDGKPDSAGVANDGDVVLGTLRSNLSVAIADAKIIIDEIRRRLGQSTLPCSER